MLLAIGSWQVAILYTDNVIGLKLQEALKVDFVIPSGILRDFIGVENKLKFKVSSRPERDIHVKYLPSTHILFLKKPKNKNFNSK